MRNKKYAIRAIVAAVAMACALGTATVASAATATVSALVGTDGNWTYGSVTRWATKANVTFAPTNLLYQAGPVNTLFLRMITPGNGDLGTTVSWENSTTAKSLKSDVTVGTPFNLRSCCYSSVGGDDSWGGTLSY